MPKRLTTPLTLLSTTLSVSKTGPSRLKHISNTSAQPQWLLNLLNFPFITTCTQFINLLTTLFTLVQATHLAPPSVPHEEFDILLDHVTLQRDRVAKMMSYAAPSPVHSRQRRHKRVVCAGACIAIAAGATLAGGLVSGAGLGLAIYNRVEADNMAERINNIEDAMEEEFVRLDETVRSSLALDDIAVAATKLSTMNLKHRSKVFWFQMSLARITADVDAIENALRSARSNRLDPAIIGSANITGMFAHLRRYATANGLSLISTKAHDLLHLPATLTSTTLGFTILTHFPLVRPDSYLEIHQHIRLPIPISSGLYLSLESSQDTIAISPDQKTFRVTSPAELSSDCHLLGHFYACPRGNSARHPPAEVPESPTSDPALCLWALFTGHTNMANMACEKTITKPATTAVQL